MNELTKVCPVVQWRESTLRDAKFLDAVCMAAKEMCGTFVSPDPARMIIAHALAKTEGDLRMRLFEAFVENLHLNAMRDRENIERGLTLLASVLEDYETSHPPRLV